MLSKLQVLYFFILFFLSSYAVQAQKRKNYKNRVKILVGPNWNILKENEDNFYASIKSNEEASLFILFPHNERDHIKRWKEVLNEVDKFYKKCEIETLAATLNKEREIRYAHGIQRLILTCADSFFSRIDSYTPEKVDILPLTDCVKQGRFYSSVIGSLQKFDDKRKISRKFSIFTSRIPNFDSKKDCHIKDKLASVGIVEAMKQKLKLLLNTELIKHPDPEMSNLLKALELPKEYTYDIDKTLKEQLTLTTTGPEYTRTNKPKERKRKKKEANAAAKKAKESIEDAPTSSQTQVNSEEVASTLGQNHLRSEEGLLISKDSFSNFDDVINFWATFKKLPTPSLAEDANSVSHQRTFEVEKGSEAHVSQL